jgi:hypothetical protein
VPKVLAYLAQVVVQDACELLSSEETDVRAAAEGNPIHRFLLEHQGFRWGLHWADLGMGVQTRQEGTDEAGTRCPEVNDIQDVGPAPKGSWVVIVQPCCDPHTRHVLMQRQQIFKAGAYDHLRPVSTREHVQQLRTELAGMWTMMEQQQMQQQLQQQQLVNQLQ